MITPDLIPDEADEWLAASDAHGLDRIFLVAPSSTEERIASTAAATRGFLYAASTMGVTGARDAVGDAAAAARRSAAGRTPTLPIGVGLGVRSRRAGGRGRGVRRRRDRRLGVRRRPSRSGGAAGARALAAELADGVRAAGPVTQQRDRLTASGARAWRPPAPGYGGGVTSDRPGLHPEPAQGVWHLGPIPIRAYALCIIAGIVVAVLLGREAVRRPRRRAGHGHRTSRCSRCRSAWSAAGSTTSPPTGRPTSAPAATRCDALKIWDGGLGIWGAVALGGVGAWIGCRRRGRPAAVLRRRRGARHRRRAGDRPAGQLLQPGALRRPDHAAVGAGDLPPGRPGHGHRRTRSTASRSTTRPIAIVQPTFLYELIWNLLVAALVVWADRRFRLGPRPGVRRLRRGLHARAGSSSS